MLNYTWISVSLFTNHFGHFRWTLDHTNLSRTEFVLKTRVQQIRIYRVDVEQSKNPHGITAQTRERPIKKWIVIAGGGEGCVGGGGEAENCRNGGGEDGSSAKGV